MGVQIRSGASGQKLEGTNENDVPLWDPVSRTWNSGPVPPPAGGGGEYYIDSYAKLEELFPADEDGIHNLNVNALYRFADTVLMADGTRIEVSASLTSLVGPGTILSTTTGALIEYSGPGRHLLQGVTLTHPTPDNVDTSCVYVSGDGRVLIEGCAMVAGLTQAAALWVGAGDAQVSVVGGQFEAYTPVIAGGERVSVQACSLVTDNDGAAVAAVDLTTHLTIDSCLMQGGQTGVHASGVFALRMSNCYHKGTTGAFVERPSGSTLCYNVTIENCYVVKCAGFLLVPGNQPSYGYKLLNNTIDVSTDVFAQGNKATLADEPNIFRGNSMASDIQPETPIEV